MEVNTNQETHQTPTPKPGSPKKKDNTLKIVLIVVGVIGGLLIIGAVAMTVFFGSLFNRATKNISVNGTKDNGSVTVKTDDGKSTATYGTDAKLPDGFPSDIPIYEPSNIIYATSTDKKHYSVSARTADSTSDVLAYYKKELATQGWKATSESSYGEGTILIYKKNNRQLSASVSTQDDKTAEKTFFSVSVTEN
jgi:hypothetical protein